MADDKKTEKAAKEDKNSKIPSAQKRDSQNKIKQLRNHSFKAKVKTAIRSFEEAVASQPKNVVMEKLNAIYSLIDKGVKTHKFTPNKASRTKSRLSAKVVS